MHPSYKKQLLLLQIELVKLQRHFIQCNNKILVIVEGRDAAGKDGVIKRIAEHLSPRETRIVALGKPSDKEKSSWYFQRFVPHLPSASELVLFNRSWYNRAGVEHVMGFCTEAEYEEFFVSVIEFEHMLIRSGISLFKYYLDISREEQASRLKERTHNETSPWTVVDADNKQDARLHVISDLLARLTYTNKDESVLLPGNKIIKPHNSHDKTITKNH